MASGRATRRIFISHAAYDTLTARVMKDVLGRAGVGRTFLDAADLRPGDQWLSTIRTAIADCDAVITLLTPEFATRPWMAAEWACFWAAGKPTYVLRLGVPREEVFSPMRTSQDADLSSVSSVTAFLDAVAEDHEENHSLAERLVERVQRARQEQAGAEVDKLLRTVLTSKDAVPNHVLTALVRGGHAEDLLRIHERGQDPEANLTRVRLKQIADLLLVEGIPSADLLPLARAIGNSNYQRDLVAAVLCSPDRGDSEEERRAFADAMLDQLTAVARQKVVAAAHDCGIQLSELWEGIDAFGS